VSENVYAGVAMLRRGMYYSGDALPESATGRVASGSAPPGRAAPSD
jgi:alkyl sulfatase BDS1-like metallo-beta-lactamase superfamily hydrolase